jgi:two-component system cell cycle response regulator DivK
VSAAHGDALVLIVEDNAKNLKLVRDLLEYHGFQTLVADSAEAGIALAREAAPDLILMDIELPGMDGVAALRELRSRPDTAAIPVVALTASAMQADRQRFTEAGFDGYLVKPIDVKAFPSQVRSHLGWAPAD